MNISKHLMLLFNFFFCVPVPEPTPISKHLMLLFNSRGRGHLWRSLPFQNISCYCLTVKSVSGFKSIIGFQNISCYCLTISHCRQRLGLNTISKHLMLLFNKHTTINLIIANNISKHLMLLFNQRKIVIFK